MNYPTTLPVQDLMTLANYISGQDKDLDKVIAAVYSLLGYGLFVWRGAKSAPTMQAFALSPEMAAQLTSLLQMLLQLAITKTKA